MRSFALLASLFLAFPTYARAATVDKFDCTVQVDAFKDEPGYTAKLKFSVVRREWQQNGMVFQGPDDQIEANITSPSSLEVQLHYTYSFKSTQNDPTHWALYQCFEGYTVYKGKKTLWACPQLQFAVSNINGVPQFDVYAEKEAFILGGPDEDVIGTYMCRLNQTITN